MNSLKCTTRNRLFLAILFSFLTVVGSGSFAIGDFVVAPRGAVTAVPRNLNSGNPIDVFLDGQQRMVATFNPETGNLFINKIEMGDLKGLGRSHEAYAGAIRQAGSGLETITGKMASDNLRALKAAGMDVSKTPSARALSKLGYTEHFLIEVIENGKKVFYRISRKPQ